MNRDKTKNEITIERFASDELKLSLREEATEMSAAGVEEIFAGELEAAKVSFRCAALMRSLAAA